MTKTMHIEGMMCGHCEATVKSIEALPEVTSAEVSHEAGTAVVTLSSEVADDVKENSRRERLQGYGNRLRKLRRLNGKWSRLFR